MAVKMVPEQKDEVQKQSISFSCQTEVVKKADVGIMVLPHRMCQRIQVEPKRADKSQQYPDPAERSSRCQGVTTLNLPGGSILTFRGAVADPHP